MVKNLSSCRSPSYKLKVMHVQFVFTKQVMSRTFFYTKKKIIFFSLRKTISTFGISVMFSLFFSDGTSNFSEEVIAEVQVLFYIHLPSCFGQTASSAAENTYEDLKIVCQSFCWLPCAVWCWAAEHTLRNNCLDLLFVIKQQCFSISGQQFLRQKANVSGYRSVLHF